jgi:bacterial/archaeal transporter family-2 protein
MDRGAAVLVAAAIGGLVAAQAPLNAQLGRTVGGLQASVLAIAVSLATLSALALVAGGGAGDLRRAGDAPWHVILGGGVIGALYVGSIVFTVRALGAGGLTAATIAGQLAIAVVIDHFGWLGVERSPVSASKLAGIGLLAAGTYLVIRD